MEKGKCITNLGTCGYQHNNNTALLSVGFLVIYFHVSNNSKTIFITNPQFGKHKWYDVLILINLIFQRLKSYYSLTAP